MARCVLHILTSRRGFRHAAEDHRLYLTAAQELSQSLSTPLPAREVLLGAHAPDSADSLSRMQTT